MPTHRITVEIDVDFTDDNAYTDGGNLLQTVDGNELGPGDNVHIHLGTAGDQVRGTLVDIEIDAL